MAYFTPHPIPYQYNDGKPLSVMKLKDIFESFDVDSNGRIDAGEYITFLKYVALQVYA